MQPQKNIISGLAEIREGEARKHKFTSATTNHSYTMSLIAHLFVTGALYLNDCPAQYLLPIYLIVSGVFGLLSGSSSGGQRFSRSESYRQSLNVCILS